MPRHRMVKSTFWVEEAIVSCSRDARLLFIGLMNHSDDSGIHLASYLTLKMEVFPGDNCSVDDIKRWVNELINNNLIREYSVNGKLYWIVLDWKERQTINRPTPSSYPHPESEFKQICAAFTEDSVSNHRQLNEDSVSLHGVLIPNIKEIKRKEDKKDICEVETSPVSIPEENISSDTNESQVHNEHPLKTSLLDGGGRDLSDASTVVAGQQECSDRVKAVFAYWQQVMNHPNAKLDKKRKGKIMQALKDGYSVEELKQAIDGCSKTPHNIGQNENGQRYDGISVIFKDSDQIDRFIGNAKNPPKPYHKQDAVSSVSDLMAGVVLE